MHVCRVRNGWSTSAYRHPQAVRLFSRITPWVIGSHLPLIRQAFANPLTLKQLSDTTCAIDEMMLRLCQYERFPFHRPFFCQLCRDRKTHDTSLSSIDQIKGPKNAEQSEAMAGHVATWHQSNAINQT